MLFGMLEELMVCEHEHQGLSTATATNRCQKQDSLKVLILRKDFFFLF